MRLLGTDLLAWHPEKRIQAMQMVVHSADIANPAKPPKFSQQWVDRVMREFFAQVWLIPFILYLTQQTYPTSRGFM